MAKTNPPSNNKTHRSVIRIPDDMAYQLTVIGVLRQPQLRASEVVTEVLTDYLRKNPAPTAASLKAEKAAAKK